ncbi:unnamed protein product [Candidula unifasciata]|uniref:F-box domain-containing protein n=1 Tax=Candidula unifasciata TaxID=100452 RepID=A0A8S3ZS60_9EUPU|nr:unnamed protein product [Candidula unifasciata]
MSVLFTFQPRPGDEMSSDSLDSDYYPGRESNDEDYEEVKRARRKHIKSRKRKNVNSTKSPVSKRKRRNVKEDDVSTDKSDGVQLHLPPEVMLKIFQHGIDAVGYINFIPRVARVSKAWNRIASDPSMRKRLDFSTEQIVLVRKYQKCLANLLQQDVSQCQYLSLHKQVHLGPSLVERALSLMPQLRTLDLTGCVVKADFVKELPQLCPHIQRLNLSSHYRYVQKKITLTSLESLIEGLGSKLLELKLTNVTAVQQCPSKVLKFVQENCPNMEVLDLGVAGLEPHSHQIFITDMDGLACGCPRLRELFLDGFNILDNSSREKPCVHNFKSLQREKPCVHNFKSLQVYSQSRHNHYGMDFPAFCGLFSSVGKLKTLNFSRSKHRPSLIAQHIKEVEELYLQDMMWSDNEEEEEVICCIAAWSRSLKVLDLSYNKLNDSLLDEALYQFEKSGRLEEEYPLEILNLSNSTVTVRGVIHVVRTCRNLKEINLSSCRELPRGSKREFGRSEFNSLVKSLRQSLRTNAGGGQQDD